MCDKHCYIAKLSSVAILAQALLKDHLVAFVDGFVMPTIRSTMGCEVDAPRAHASAGGVVLSSLCFAMCDLEFLFGAVLDASS